MPPTCPQCPNLPQCAKSFSSGAEINCRNFSGLSALLRELPKSSVRTCRNCACYHPTMCGTGDFHIHDYCSLWGKQIPGFVIFDRLEFESGYDDIESGLACCWAFQKKDGEIQTEFPIMFQGPFETKPSGESEEIQ